MAKRAYLIVYIRVALLAFLLVSSGMVIHVTSLYTRNARDLAESSLESTGLALSASAENALRAGGGREDEIRAVLADTVVAYALIAGKDGTILFHTNPQMVGSVVPDMISSGRTDPAERHSGRRVTLGTGLPAYEFDYPLHREGGRPETLRIVLHTNRADAIIARGKTMWETVGTMLALLWLAGILVERMATHTFRVRAEADDKERLALIGQMTATLAHEIRNAVAGIKGFTQWMIEKAAPSDPCRKGLDAILQGTGQIETLVDELLAFSREESYAAEAVDPAAILEEAVGDVAAGWGGSVATAFGGRIRALADPDKLRRVLLNGVRNALQAMGEAGRLSLSVQDGGRYAVVRIEDTGSGIRESDAARLFTPFFTTKADGTGLGLAYSRKVIEGMGGTIDLANREGAGGAALVIRLPKA